MKKIIPLIFLLLLLLPIASAQYPIGTVFKNSEGKVFLITAYIDGKYEISSATGIYYINKDIVESWTPFELETSYERMIRLSKAAVVGGIIKPELYGDLNGDGKFTKDDAVIAVSAFRGTETINSYQRIAADVNGDGSYNKSDAVLLTLYFFDSSSPPPRSNIGEPIPNALSTITPTPIPVVTNPYYTPVPTSTPIVVTTIPADISSIPSKNAEVTFYFNSFSSNNITGDRIRVPKNSEVDIYVILNSSAYTSGNLKVEVRRDFSISLSSWSDDIYRTFEKNTPLLSGHNNIYAGTFKASDVTGENGFVQYYLNIYWNDNKIYNPTDRITRSQVVTIPIAPTYPKLTPISTSASTSTLTSTPLSTLSNIPGFESLLALIGIGIVSYLVLKQRKEE